MHNNNSRLQWIDGLRGYACIAIAIHHFVIGFFPAAFYLYGYESHFYNLDTYFSQCFWGGLINGNFLVCIFMTISGLVLSRSVMNLKEKGKVSSIIVKRYPRLAFPMFFACLFTYVVQRMNLFTNSGFSKYSGAWYYDGSFSTPLSIKQVFTTSLYRIWFLNDTGGFGSPYWMLQTLFMGSFVAILLGIITWNANHSLVYLTFLIAVLFYCRFPSYTLCFIFGALLAYISHSLKNQKSTLLTIMGSLSLLSGFFLGGYPTEGRPNNYYLVFTKIEYFTTANPSLVWHILGASLFVFGVLCLPVIQAVFSTKPLLFLGKISYAVYLLHYTILCSFSTGVFKYMIDKQITYPIAGLTTLGLSLIVIIILAFLFNRYIESACSHFSNWLVGKMFP